jgi:catechol 2,3-dioxygenase-like lactoylglutathione lyase family enzyme
MAEGPAFKSVHHISVTSTNAEASAAWYQKVFGMDRVPVTFPHNEDEGGGFAILLIDPKSGLAIGIHHHNSNDGTPADESKAGLDHLGLAVENHDALKTWVEWLNSNDIKNSGVIDITEPMPYSVVVFRDPDNIQLEMFYMAG